MSRFLPLLVLLLLLAVFLFTGAMGLNFGRHWDESFAEEQIARPFENGVFLPGSYNYPSMVFDIGTVLLAPEAAPFLLKTAKNATPYYSQPYQDLVPKAKAAPIVEFAQSQHFLLRLRAVFLILTSLTGLWTYLAVRACQRSSWEAALAGAVILTSFEIAYHARWVAPDTIQMQFAALWLMLFSFGLYSARGSFVWFRLAAAAAGLACGTKYQGGVLLLPVLFQTAAILWRTHPVGLKTSLLKELGIQVGIFTAVFVISTPGAILQPLAFCQSLRAMGHQYVTDHGGYTVHAGGEHAYLLLVYLAAVLNSHWPLLALVLTLFAIVGAVILFRENPAQASLLLSVPVLYFAYIICYRVMIVRNYLLLAPFFALLVARGVFALGDTMFTRRWPHRLAVALCVAIFAINIAFLFYAAGTIRQRTAPSFGADLATHLKKHGATAHYLSPQAGALVQKEEQKFTNVTADANAAGQCVLLTSEVTAADWDKWICNRLGWYRMISGPLEVNLDYYGGWPGPPMLVELSMAQARKMKLLPHLQ